MPAVGELLGEWVGKQVVEMYNGSRQEVTRPVDISDWGVILEEPTLEGRSVFLPWNRIDAVWLERKTWKAPRSALTA